MAGVGAGAEEWEDVAGRGRGTGVADGGWATFLGVTANFEKAFDVAGDDAELANIIALLSTIGLYRIHPSMHFPNLEKAVESAEGRVRDAVAGGWPAIRHAVMNKTTAKDGHEADALIPALEALLPAGFAGKVGKK